MVDVFHMEVVASGHILCEHDDVLVGQTNLTWQNVKELKRVNLPRALDRNWMV